MIMFSKSAKIATINLAVLFVFLEIGLRSIVNRGAPSYSQYNFRVGTGFYKKSETNTFALQPGYKGLMLNQDHNLPRQSHKVNVKINNDGFRNTIPPLPCSTRNARKRSIALFLGDSFTFGYNLDDHDTYPSAYQRIINNAGKCIKVVNAGYANGYEADQIHSWLSQNIKLINPKIVIYNVFAGNDITGINKNSWKNVDVHGLPTKWIDDSIYVDHGVLKQVGVKPAYFIYRLPVLRESKLLVTLENELRKLLSHSVREKYTNAPPDMGHLYGYENADFRVKEEYFIQLIQGMNRLARSNGATFVVSYLPANFEVYPDIIKLMPIGEYPAIVNTKPIGYGKRLCTKLKSLHIKCIDNTSEMIISNKQSELSHKELLNSNTFFPEWGEIHFSKSGAEFAAKLVYEETFDLLH